MLYATLIQPFELEEMRRALVACLALSMACGPLGVFLLLRRMGLMGDALSHAILPGVAVAFLTCGMSTWPMMIGGLVAGVVLLISYGGGDMEVMHVLFGDILAIRNDSLYVMAGVTSFTLLLLAVMFRGLVLECFDSVFLRCVHGRGGWFHMGFLVLVVLNLVAGFQALGTLMTLGLMILPALATIDWQMGLAAVIALAASVLGLLVAYHTKTESGPAIVLVAGGFYVISMLGGAIGSVRAKYIPHHHLQG